MIRYLLDTDMCIDIIRKRKPAVLSRLQASRIGEVGISTITFAELTHGVEKSAKPDQNRLALYEFCTPLQVAPFSDMAALAYGRIRVHLERLGRIIGPMDLLIAAHALALDAVLVTGNLREFRRIPELKLESWL